MIFCLIKCYKVTFLTFNLEINLSKLYNFNNSQTIINMIIHINLTYRAFPQLCNYIIQSIIIFVKHFLKKYSILFLSVGFLLEYIHPYHFFQNRQMHQLFIHQDQLLKVAFQICEPFPELLAHYQII